MANRVAKILGGVVVLAAVGAGAAWYTISGNIVANTQKLMTKLEADPTAPFKVKAESITRAAFPAIGVRITNPSFEMAIPAGQDGKSKSIMSNVHSTTDIVTDYLGHQYRVVSKMSGDSTTVIGDESITYTTSPATLTATLKAKDFKSFNAWNRLNFDDANATKSALENIAMASMVMSPITMTDTTSGKVIITQDKSEMAAVNRSTDAMVDFDFNVDIKGAEVAPEYYEMIKKVMGNSGGNSPLAMMDMPFSGERAGKQDLKLDMTVKAPIGAVGMKTGLIDIRDFAMKNNYYTISLPTRLELKAGDAPVGVAKLNWTIDATPAGAAEMQRTIDMGMGVAGGMFRRVDAQGQPTALPADLKEKITAALPTLSTLGPVTLTLDVEAAMQAMGQPPKAITINDFNFNHKRWGLAMKGATSSDAQAGQKVDLTITCTQCEAMTSDMVTTAYQAEQVQRLMEPTAQPWGITQATLASVNNFLSQIGKKDDSGNLVIAITTPAPNDIRVNGRALGEVMMQAMAVMVPQTAPAAGQEAAPAAPAAPVAVH